MASVARVRLDTFTPTQLVEQARKGRLRVPAFQRSYRWEPDDVEDLFDSVLKRYPIGNLLLWESPAEAERIVLGPLVTDAPATTSALLIVDGQQRIISLVGALSAPAEVADPRFAVYVDLTTREFRATRRDPGPGWLPLRVAGSNQALLNWQRERWGLLDDDQFAVADDVASALREYSIPCYVVQADEEREVRVVFDRMNSAGHPLSGDEVFDALHGMQGSAEPGDLGAVAIAVSRTGFGLLAKREVRRSLLALRGPDIFRDMRKEFGRDEAARTEAFALVERVLLDVVSVLRDEFDVPHARLLPYPSVVPLLAAYVHRFGRPQGRATTLLRRWFWRGAALGANPAGSPPRVRRTLRVLSEAPDPGAGARALLAASPPSEAWTGPDLTQTSMNRALTRVNVDGLLGLAPRRLPRSESSFDSPELVASELLEGPGPPLVPLLPASAAGSWGPTLANRLVHPARPDDGRSAVRALLDSNVAVRASHGIDDEVAELLAAGEWEDALARRASVLARTIRAFVDDRAEWGALDGPTDAELMGAS